MNERIKHFVLSALADGEEHEGRDLRKASMVVLGVPGPAPSTFYRATHHLEEEGVISGRNIRVRITDAAGRKRKSLVRLYRMNQ